MSSFESFCSRTWACRRLVLVSRVFGFIWSRHASTSSFLLPNLTASSIYFWLPFSEANSVIKSLSIDSVCGNNLGFFTRFFVFLSFLICFCMSSNIGSGSDCDSDLKELSVSDSMLCDKVSWVGTHSLLGKGFSKLQICCKVSVKGSY